MPGPSTRAVHAGERPHDSGALNTPIVQSTTYRYPERADGAPSDYIYSRYDNPTVQAAEAKLAALEGADAALAFASGTGATQAVCQAFLRPGDTIAVLEGVYGGTMAYLHDELAPMGIEVRTVSIDEPPAFDAKTKLVWVESITNPLLRVPDLPRWADAAHDAGARLAVDATFATPALQRPLEHGADIVVHSASKYLGGHSDVTAGFVACRGDDRDTLWTRRRNLGATLDPHAAFLLARGMKTLPLRVARHCDNARAVAAALADAGVDAVHHPGRDDHPDREPVAALLDDTGGMVTIDLGSLDRAKAFRRGLQTIAPAASLGGVESLASLPLETSHAYASDEDRARQGITDGLVRISCGIEDPEDLVADVMQALEAAQETAEAA